MPSPTADEDLGRTVRLGWYPVAERVKTILTERSSWLAPVVLGCLALAVRLPNLGHTAELDELYHFFAAQSWLVEGQLRVADGVYNRTALFTIFLAQWLGLFGESLVAARLPSLIAGTALVVLVFVWTRAVAGRLAALFAAVLLALDPEHLQLSQLIRFYTLQFLFFWLGAIGTYRLVTSPPPRSGRMLLLVVGIVVCFGAALYLQVTTLVGLLGVATWLGLVWGLPRFGRCPPRTRCAIAAGLAIIGAGAIVALVESRLAAELLHRYRSTPLFGAENRDAFWFYHALLTIYYPTLWPLVALAGVIGLAYHPQPTGYCACVVAVAFVVHSFAASKGMRYLFYAAPFLFVLWGIALAEIWPRLWRFLADACTRAMISLGFGQLGRPGAYAVLASVLVFTIAANGAWVRTAAEMFGFVIPPMKRQADWAAAKDGLLPYLAEAAIVLTTDELATLYYLGRYEILISKSRLSEFGDGREFSIDPRTGRPVVSRPESVALIMDCYPKGLIIASDVRWGSPEHLDDAVASLVEARAEGLELAAREMRAYLWRQPDDARRAEACARLPAGMGEDPMAKLDPAYGQ